jgi:hypothetical protein
MIGVPEGHRDRLAASQEPPPLFTERGILRLDPAAISIEDRLGCWVGARGAAAALQVLGCGLAGTACKGWSHSAESEFKRKSSLHDEVGLF